MVDGKALRFGHEGVLYRNSFVMYDKKTNSKWIHTLGVCVKGPMKGKKLDFIPSTVIHWGDWKKEHPNTLYLSGIRVKGFMGTFKGGTFSKNFGLSVGSGYKTKLYPYNTIAYYGLIQDIFEEKNIVVTWSKHSLTAVAFIAKIDGQKLIFKLTKKKTEGVPTMMDIQTESIWDSLTGKCLEGKQKGKKLKQLSATPWLISAWKGFYGSKNIYSSKKKKTPVK